MKYKQHRGKASKVELLPDELKKELLEMLKDKKLSQKAIVEEINALISQAGLDASYQISKSSLNRYAIKMEQMGAKIRQAREVAEIWSRKFAQASEHNLSRVVLEMIQQIAFENLLDENNEKSPKQLSDLANVIYRLEQAESVNHKRALAIKKEMAEMAADEAVKIGKSAGLNQETVNKLKAQILGLV